MSWNLGSRLLAPRALTRGECCTLTICAAFTLAMTGCVNDDVTSPRRSPPIGRLVPNATHQLIGGTFGLAVPGNSASPLFGGAPWQATGIRVRRGVNVRSRMPLTFSASYNQPPPPESWSCLPWNIPEGEVNPGRNPLPGPPGQDSLGTVRYTIAPDSAGSIGPNPTLFGAGWNRLPDASWKAVEYMGAQAPDSGFLYFKRYQLDGECFGFVKYNLSGNQAITVDFPEIVVTSNYQFVPQGSSVQFTAAANGFTVASNQWFWKWQPTSGPSIDVGQCLGQATCTYAPAGTGNMLVSALDSDNLLYKGESAAVEIMLCPTPDSIMNHPVMRAALLRALDSSFVDSAPHKRRERAGWIYRDTTRALSDPLALQILPAASQPSTNPCRGSHGGRFPDDPPFVFVAYFHTHPFTAGGPSTAADIIPSNCGSEHGAGGRYRPGPSDDFDWPASDQLNVPGYIIDKDVVQRFDGNDPAAANRARRQFLVETYHWNTATCRW